MGEVINQVDKLIRAEFVARHKSDKAKKRKREAREYAEYKNAVIEKYRRKKR